MDDLLEEVRKYVKVRTTTYMIMMPQLAEDALQEAYIQAWRDVEAGVTPKLKILRRAALATERFFQNKGETPFGKPHQSRHGISSHSQTLEKVQAFVAEYMPVHNKYPSGRETCDALGIKMSAAQNALKRIREGRLDHGVYWTDKNGNRHRDREYYVSHSVESFGSGTNSNMHWSDAPEFSRFREQSFENDIDTRITFDKHMADLSEKHRQTLHMYLYLGYNTGDLGRALGYKKTPSQHGTKILNSAINQLQIRMNPYDGECPKGHTRTEANTRLDEQNGSIRRFCRECDKKK